MILILKLLMDDDSNSWLLSFLCQDLMYKNFNVARVKTVNWRCWYNCLWQRIWLP